MDILIGGQFDITIELVITPVRHGTVLKSQHEVGWLTGSVKLGSSDGTGATLGLG